MSNEILTWNCHEISSKDEEIWRLSMSSNPPAIIIGIKILTGEHEIFSQAASDPFLHWLASCMGSKFYFFRGLIQVVRLRNSFFWGPAAAFADSRYSERMWPSASSDFIPSYEMRGSTTKYNTFLGKHGNRQKFDTGIHAAQVIHWRLIKLVIVVA